LLRRGIKEAQNEKKRRRLFENPNLIIDWNLRKKQKGIWGTKPGTLRTHKSMLTSVEHEV